MAPAKDHSPGEGHYPCSYSPFEPEPLAGVPLDFLASFPPISRQGQVSLHLPATPARHAPKGCQGTASQTGSDVTTWGSL